jgi:DNA-binding HxlR family transcriptional regulator
MQRTDRRSDCPINFALQTFGDAWSLLVIRDLMFTERRTYSDFLGAEEGMATNILANRLVRLRRAGLIARSGRGKGARYGLTEKGLDLLPAMLQVIAWSARHDRLTQVPPAFAARIRKAPATVAADLRRKLEVRFGLPAAHVKP